MYVFNYDATLLYELYNVKVNVQMVKRANGYKPWLYNITVDACEFQRRRNNPMIKMVFNIFKNYSNLNHPCPYRDSVHLYGLYLKPQLIPIPLPTGEYGLLTTWNFDNKTISTVNLYFEFKEDAI
ncbi:uncharacterized protein LOC127565835 [Drosophila albomicans]|uniref:Uncharacterized protein LOC127565835 n=1 Tax=Drosophila albomicans TaxID=7291 RepID=A0A9C6WCH0_DROAB|nr:uncharacterized protein LOC127565835 [Drosophila albomicans]